MYVCMYIHLCVLSLYIYTYIQFLGDHFEVYQIFNAYDILAILRLWSQTLSNHSGPAVGFAAANGGAGQQKKLEQATTAADTGS